MVLATSEFLILFQQVKNRTNQNPKNLLWMCKNDDKMVSLAFELNCSAATIARQFATKREKFIPQAPIEFIRAYKNYLEKYEGVVKIIANRKEREFIDCFNDKYEQNPEKTKAQLLASGIDLDAPAEFNVLKDDPVDSFYDMLFIVENMADTPVEFREDWHDEIHKAAGAWRFFEDTIGIDLQGICQRWKATPITFVPKHVSDQHGLTEPGSLYDMLRQAHRAYVFGCERAAMALCRALMEVVLKKHWGIENDETFLQWKRKNHGHDPGLKKIIAIAEAKYDAKYKLKSHRLLQQKDLADDVLHPKSEQRHLSGDEVRLFLETLKFLIEEAPQLA